MKDWLRALPGGLLAFLLIACLVAGGLGWVTAAALRLEADQLAARAEGERAALLRLALWRLDSGLAPPLAREDIRPHDHYSAVFAPALTLRSNGSPWQVGSVLELSPLLTAELPGWMLLHFQAEPAAGWSSPQAPSPTLLQRLQRAGGASALGNLTPRRRQLLDELGKALPATDLLEALGRRARPDRLRETTLVPPAQPPDSPLPQAGNAYQGPYQSLDRQSSAQIAQQYTGQMNNEQDFEVRASQLSRNFQTGKNPQRLDRNVACNNLSRNGEGWFHDWQSKESRGAETVVQLSPMVPLWVEAGGERLLLARLVHLGDRSIAQGIVLDAAWLREELAADVADLFPGARLLPAPELEADQLERTMSALPFRLDPGPLAAPADPGWTALRVGLALAWTAALVALLAVALGGWSLLDLSERRIRFVSAVTHELRTPLTTLRLYLDMLTGGLVRDPGQRDEYLQTLHAEADRLHRLIANVLDFSRLEKQRPRLTRARASVADLLRRVGETWEAHCRRADKELVLQNDLGPDASLWIDGELVQQVLGNLIDNACKYGRPAADPRLGVRVYRCGRHVHFRVEDHGPGIPARERRGVFRPFRRGRGADVAAGGVGLGLALARRWAHLLGGRLFLDSTPGQEGACFVLEVPDRH